MTNRFLVSLALYRKALDSRTEPESIVLIGRTVWTFLLVILTMFVVVAIGLGIYDLSTTLAVLDQDGKSSEVKLPALDRAQLSALSDYFSGAPARFQAAKQSAATATDPSK
jgi:flagellar biosynthesis protein FliP